jgi:hypothetical protein
VKMPNARMRRYMYRIGIAGIGVLAVYGIVTGEEIAAWSLLAAALLGVADANVDSGDAG